MTSSSTSTSSTLGGTSSSSSSSGNYFILNAGENIDVPDEGHSNIRYTGLAGECATVTVLTNVYMVCNENIPPERFVWDADDTYGGRHVFTYIGEYIERSVGVSEFKIIYNGLGSFLFTIEMNANLSSSSSSSSESEGNTSSSSYSSSSVSSPSTSSSSTENMSSSSDSSESSSSSSTENMSSSSTFVDTSSSESSSDAYSSSSSSNIEYFEFKVNPVSDGQTFEIGFDDAADMIVDFGDGNVVTKYGFGTATNSYATAGEYIVRMSGGTCSRFYMKTNRQLVTELLTPIPDFGITSFLGTFWNCDGLIEILPGLFDNNVNVTTFRDTFRDCSNITGIPSGLFYKNINAEIFQQTFALCPQITSIPSGLFDNNVNATTFRSCFFAGKTGSAISSIPSGLFINNINAEDFYEVFRGCSNITGIPSNIFNASSPITTFYRGFYGCTSLTGNAPELWNTWPVATGDGCFTNCTGLTNWGDIPSSWGGGGA